MFPQLNLLQPKRVTFSLFFAQRRDGKCLSVPKAKAVSEVCAVSPEEVKCSTCSFSAIGFEGALHVHRRP